MERKIDVVEAFQQGYQEGQLAFLKLINQFCGFTAKNTQELIHMINERKDNDAL